MEQENLSSRYEQTVATDDVCPWSVQRENPKCQTPQGAEYRCETQGRTDS